jgi:hypothetical protein
MPTAKADETFLTPVELQRNLYKRRQELQVLGGELESLSAGAKVFEGSGGRGTVFFLAHETKAQTKAKVKRELAVIGKKMENAQQQQLQEADKLNF